MIFKRNLKKLLGKIFKWISLRTVSDYGSVHVNYLCKFTKNTRIGNNCNFNGMKVYGEGKVAIGDNFHSGKQCLILTSNHNYEGKCIPYDETYVSKDVIIENNVWIGTRVIILGGVRIGEGAIIQAGSVVTKDIDKLGIAGGHPATVFKFRDKNHYEKLKKQKSFF